MNIVPAPGTYGLRTPSATILLGDNDSFPSGSVSFSSPTSAATESVGTHNVAVNIAGIPAGDVTVNYHVTSGTATGGGYDFTLANGMLTFPAGTTTLNIPVTIYQDSLPEAAETLAIQLYTVTGGNLGTSTHTVTINNLSMPEAFTDAASALLSTSATLNGRVSPNAAATDVWFQYGPTTAYGSTTTVQSVGSGTASINVSASISGFAPGGYHYRCVAQNASGISYGIDQTISSNNADLTNLLAGAVVLNPAFAASTIAYTSTVSNATTSVTVTPTVAQANATVKVNGTNVTSGSASSPIPLVVGLNSITTIVTAQDGTTTKTYTLTVTRLPSTNADLADFAPSAGTLAPSFGATTLAYTATVPHTTTSVTMTPAVAQANATVKVNGTNVTSGSASSPIPLVIGVNSINTIVTAQDGTTTKTYTLTVTRLPSTNANLAGLTPSAGTLSPSFGATTLAYTATVPHATTSVTMTPAVAQANATVKVNGINVTSGSASSQIPLVVGLNPITTTVTAQDGTTTKTYTLTVTRLPSTHADLAGLASSAGLLSPVFAATTLDYTAIVPNATTSLAITATVAQANATLTMNGTAVVSGNPSLPYPLAVGITPIVIIVTAQDGFTTQIYTFNITRLPSSNADLAGLIPSEGTLSPAFTPVTLAYTSAVPYTTASVTITPMVAQANATVQVNDITVTSGSASNPVSLDVGVNPITTVVTAEDGTTTKTYTVNITRSAPPSNNADLASLEPSAGTLSPAFNASDIDYTATVSNETESLSITPTLAETNATVKVNGATVTSGLPSTAIPLAVGVTPIITLVTAEDGTTIKNYTVIVTRDAPLSSIADLASLAPSVGTLSPAFSPTATDYTATVPNAIDSLTITPTLAETNATVNVNGAAVLSGTSSTTIPLTVGVTPIVTTVTAEDGTTLRSYTVNVTRAPLPFVQWQISFFNSSTSPDAALNADPDFDGIENLLEYFLSGIPAGPGASDTSILPTILKTETSVVFKFRRTKTAALEFSTRIESTSVLSQNDWAPVANETIAVESLDSFTELVTATIPLPPAPAGLFVRLRVQTNP